MITFSLFEKLMRDEMPQDQEELDAVLLVDDKKEHLINHQHQQPRAQLDLRETGDERETE